MEPGKGGTPKSFLSVPPLPGSDLLLHPTQGCALGYFIAPLGLKRNGAVHRTAATRFATPSEACGSDGGPGEGLLCLHLKTPFMNN